SALLRSSYQIWVFNPTVRFTSYSFFAFIVKRFRVFRAPLPRADTASKRMAPSTTTWSGCGHSATSALLSRS
ncbi:hypothetical protein ABLO01_17765, partial [Mycobacterium tuberculosis]|uniref:hypothetical protein n=1 Tax=Mycobacterium tuberculosis TaxID=1773 RepID=UPI0032B5C4D1